MKFERIKKILKPVEIEYLIFASMLLLSLSVNLVVKGENQFSVLSKQFLEGKLYLPNAVGDAVLYQGKYYWHLGPLPILVLIPFTLITLPIFSIPMPQGLLNFLIIPIIIYLIYKISLKFSYKKRDSRWLSIAVAFGSVFILSALMPWSWYFSQTITFLFGLLALREYLEKNRPMLIGLYHAFMFMTRVTSGFGIVFYLLASLFSQNNIKKKVKDITLMSIPIIVSGLLLLTYNYVRFSKPLDNGYVNSNNWVDNENFRYEILNYGLFNIKNIPTNFYYYFISGPSPVLEKVEGFRREIYGTDPSMIIHLVFPYIKVSTPGVSFFVVSPIFLLIFRNKLKGKNSKYALFTSLFILSFLLTYYWTGWTQIGPRYMIDLLPFLFILLLESTDKRNVSSKQKVLITISVFFNFFLFCSLFG